METNKKALCNQSDSKNNEPAQPMVTTELLRTHQSWDGAELPGYPAECPELVAIPKTPFDE